MRDGWKRVAIGEVADVAWGDLQTTKASYVPEGFLAYSATGPDGFLPGYDFDRPGIVLSAIGTIGKTWLATGKWSCIANTIRIFPTSDDLDVRFLHHQLSRPELWPRRGSSQQFIAQKDARALLIVVPPLTEQKRIVDLIEAVDAYVASLESYATAARTARAALLHELLTTNTKGWKETTLGEVAEVRSGFAFKGSSFSSNGIPVVKIGNVKDGSVELAGCSFVPEYVAQTATSYELRRGDLLITLTGYVGETGRIRYTERSLLNQRVGRIDSLSSEALLDFIELFFRMDTTRMQIKSLAAGLAQPNVSPKQIAGLKFLLPPLAEQERIVDVIRSVDEAIAGADRASEDARNLRSGLLSDLLSGDHGIPESYDELLGAA